MSEMDLVEDLPTPVQTENPVAPPATPTIAMPVPDGAPVPPDRHPTLGVPTSRYAYHDAAGGLLGFVCRFDTDDKGKQFRPLTFWRCPERDDWRWEAWPTPRPLYGLQRVRQLGNAAVLIVEGEKTADAVARLLPHCVVLTSPNGSGSAGKADWRPVSGCAEVVIVGDADEPGSKYAEEVAQQLLDLNVPRVRVVNGMRLFEALHPGDTAAKGWDLADAEHESLEGHRVREAIEQLAEEREAGPRFVSFHPYTMDQSGLRVERTVGRGDNAITEPVWISDPFEIVIRVRDPRHSGWGRSLRFRDPDGKPHEVIVGDNELFGEAKALGARLADQGLRLSTRPRDLADVVAYVNSVDCPHREFQVARTGWHEVDGRHVFVLTADIALIATPTPIRLKQAAEAGYAAVGTLREWHERVAAPAQQHHLLVLAICTALSGPLLKLAGQESGVFHLYGPSSRGKSTALALASSVWGPGASPGFIRTWRATANGLEGLASARSDTFLALDELGVGHAHDISQAAYMITGGVPKARMRREGGLREAQEWRVTALSTGEMPFETKVAENGGRRAQAGQKVRFIDLPADAGAGLGIFTTVGDAASASDLADRMKTGATQVYGTAGPAFVDRIMTEGPELVGDRTREMAEAFAKAIIPDGADGQVRRVTNRFGHVAAAGELAIAFGILPWSPRTARDAASFAFELWLKERGNAGSAEEEAMVAFMRGLIERYESRFEDIDINQTFAVPNRLGYREGQGSERTYFLLPQSFKQECETHGFQPRAVTEALKKRGLLKLGTQGEAQMVKKIGGRPQRVYAVRGDILGEELPE